MKPHELPSLSMRPLATISPSSFVALRRCPLRVIWAAHSLPLLPRSPKTRIGTVIHHLWEAAAGGRIADESTFDTVWQAEIDAQEREMMQDWKEIHLVPLSVSVPDLEVMRLRCRRQLTNWRPGIMGTKHRTEQTVTDATSVVKGRIDIIVTDADGAHLIDLKTGAIIEADGTVKKEYTQQLRLYAALYHQTTGYWPASLTLRTADGTDTALTWTPDECSILLTEALSLQARINNLVKQDIQGEILAKPAPDTCYFCPFRPACPHYWHARQASPQEKWPSDAMGRIEHITQLGNGRWKMRLVDGVETVHLRGLSPKRQTFLANPPAKAAFYNLRCENDGQYVEGAMTTGYGI